MSKAGLAKETDKKLKMFDSYLEFLKQNKKKTAKMKKTGN